ncbi:glycosyltransferase [Candidatus Dojkabacteria bacterium]|nr:glycosyltransferase [Candidatus Dojkabacteria bacterium]
MIDVIIPVYNSLDHLRKCIDSVVRNTIREYRVIFVNDKSSDAKILPYLKKICKENSNFILLENKENIGFVGSVNRGMKYSKDDVVLLNSDTIVTSNWLSKMREAAYSSPSVGTVTPFSNSATICSIPVFCQDNKLPDGYDIELMGNLVEKKSLKKYPELPTSVGFCMYIKRIVIDTVGFFDEVHFGKGYGEENDFSERSQKVGFKDILDDSTFIYHAGSASFTNEIKIERQKISIKIMESLHPGYSDKIARFVLSNPLREIQDNIINWINIYREDTSRPKVLIVKHFEPITSGVSVFVKSIIEGNDNYVYYVFYYNPQGHITLERWFKSEKTCEWSFPLPSDSIKQDSLCNSNIEKIFRRILEYLNISLVNFHHILGLPVSLLGIAKELDIPCIFSVHDHILLNSSPFLSVYDKSLQENIFFKDIDEYQEYISSAEQDFSFEFVRQRYIKKVLDSFDLVVVPSDYMVDAHKQLFPKSNIVINEHGLDFDKKIVNDFDPEGKVTIAFLGTAAEHKGILDFVKLSQNEQLKDLFEWKIIGGIDKGLEDILSKKDLLDEFQSIYRTGSYSRDNLQTILENEKVNIILIPSVCCESFSYTLSEAIQFNIPVIGKNIGAVGERLARYDIGWRYDTLEECIDILREIASNKDLLAKQRLRMKDISMNSLKNTITSYDAYYKDLVKVVKLDKYIQKSRISLNQYFAQKVGDIEIVSKKQELKDKKTMIAIVKRFFERTKVGDTNLRNIQLMINHKLITFRKLIKKIIN